MTATARTRCSTASPYQGYVYAYPHKTAYRPLDPPRAARATLWADEPRDALFLYLHVPFCEMRCGFCNLFTQRRTRRRPRRRATSTRSARQAERGPRRACGDATLRPAGDRRRHADLPRRGRAGRRCSTSPSGRWAPTCGAIPVVGRDVARTRSTPEKLALLREPRASTGSASACRASSRRRPRPSAGRSSAADVDAALSTASARPASRRSTST